MTKYELVILHNKLLKQRKILERKTTIQATRDLNAINERISKLEADYSDLFKYKETYYLNLSYHHPPHLDLNSEL